MAIKLDFKIAKPEQIIQHMGATLAQIRIGREVTQAELAASAGISTRTLSRLESGEKATLDTFVRLMQALGLEAHLAALLPDPGIQPVQQLKSGNAERKRVRARTEKNDEDDRWSWDEGTTP